MSKYLHFTLNKCLLLLWQLHIEGSSIGIWKCIFIKELKKWKASGNHCYFSWRITQFFLSFFKILNGGNVTKSILHFHPRPTDHGKTLTCRAENTELSHAAIEDHWKLVIHCKFWGAFLNWILAFFINFCAIRIVWILLKMSQLYFGIFWHFPRIFVKVKVTCLVMLFDCKLSFSRTRQINYFLHFNSMLRYSIFYRMSCYLCAYSSNSFPKYKTIIAQECDWLLVLFLCHAYKWFIFDVVLLQMHRLWPFPSDRI